MLPSYDASYMPQWSCGMHVTPFPGFRAGSRECGTVLWPHEGCPRLLGATAYSRLQQNVQYVFHYNVSCGSHVTVLH